MMNAGNLRKLIAKGNVKDAIKNLVDLYDKYLLPFGKEILIISSRFHSATKNNLANTIRTEDYNLEINSISKDILEVADLIEELDENRLRVKLESNIIEKINELARQFDECSEIGAVHVRLRMKNSIASKIGECILQSPEIIKSLLPTEKEGIICGICRKIESVPEFGDLEILELIVDCVPINTSPTSNFTRGNVTNAIAALVYSNKLQIGDDKLIRKTLNGLEFQSDRPLKKNIERVEAALDYLMGIE